MTLPPRGRRLRAASVAALSAVLLGTGCDADPQPVPADEVTVEEPVAAPVADATSRADWKASAYEAVGCSTRAAWVADGLPGDVWDAETVRTTSVDVTGDGADEVLVQLSCPAAVSTRADHVVVFRVAGRAPEVLAVLGDDLFHQEATVTTGATTVTLSGPTVAADDPYCCPGHWGTVTYRWDRARFVVQDLSEVPGTSPVATTPPADGEHVGVLLAVGHDEVTVDPVEWFEGEAALAACAEDGVPVWETAWCTQYYVRDPDARAVAVRVADSASLSYLDLATMRDVRVDDVAELAGTSWVSANPEGAGYTRFRIEDGVITSLESIYTP